MKKHLNFTAKSLVLIFLLITSFSMADDNDNIVITYNLQSSGYPELKPSLTAAALSLPLKWDYEGLPLEFLVGSSLKARQSELEKIYQDNYENIKKSPFCPSFALSASDVGNSGAANGRNELRLAAKNEIQSIAVLSFQYDYLVSYYSSSVVWVEPRIIELDILLRDDFFKRNSSKYNADLIKIFHFASGHQSSLWESDPLILGSQDQDLQQEWQNLVGSRNQAVYVDPVAEEAVNKPFIFPARDQIINLSSLITGGAESAQSMFITNLKALDKSRNLKLTIFRLDSEGQSLGKLIKVTGWYPDFPFLLSSGKKIELIYNRTIVGIGKAGKMKALLRKLDKYGKSARVQGKKYSKALRIRVEMQGYLPNDIEIKKVAEDYWLVID